MVQTIKQFNILIIIGLFCIIYNPPIIPINSMHVVGALSIAYLLLKCGRKLQCEKEVLRVYVGFTLAFLYLFIIAAISLRGDLSTAVSSVYYLIDILPFALVLKKYVIKYKISTDAVIQLIMFLAIIQAIIAICSFVFPPFHSFLIGRYMAYGYTDVYSRMAEYRMFGLAGTLTFSTPVLQSFLSVFAIYYAKNNGKKYLAISLLLIFSAVINARTSLIVFVVGVFVVLFFSDLSLKTKLKILLLCIFALGFSFYAVSIILEKYSSLTYEWIKMGIEEIFGLFRGQMEGGYFEYITNKERYVLPITFIEKILGTGHAIQGGFKKYGVYSDIGFINDIWRGGIVYVLGMYTFLLGIMNKMRKSTNEAISFLGLLSIITCIVVNFKGGIFNMNELTNTIVVLYLSTCLRKSDVEARYL